MELAHGDTTSSTSTSPNPPSHRDLPTANERTSLSSACVACREKHLKCDGLQVCTRCSTQGLTCVYLKSRRGYRGTVVHSKKARSLNDSASDASGSGSVNKKLDSSFMTSSGTPVGENVLSSSLGFPLLTEEAGSNALYSRLFLPNHQQRCIAGFFQYVYDSHPFLPPRHQLLNLLQNHPLDNLRTAMCYMGSRYVPGSSPTLYMQELESYLSNSAAPKNAYVVQTMLLFALGLDAENEQTKAVEILIKAQNLAVELGMNQREYAIVNGRGSPICEESLRRTWWELYVVSILVAGLHGKEIFHPRGTMSNVPLPCEEKEFESGVIPQLHTMEDFENESFMNEEIEWSSSAYRIVAARNLDRILQSEQFVFADQPAIYRLEAHLTNWHLHLPRRKRTFIDTFGSLDEMLFQANMITNVSSILLHRQFSALESLAVHTITSCTGQPTVALGTRTDNAHTAMTIQAASNISKLVALPGSLLRHTHFFVCALTLSSISHLSLWSALPIMAADQDLKQQIRMNAGALKALSSVFPSARVGFQQMTMVAQKIHANRKDAVDEVFWRDLVGEDFMTGLIENTSTIGT